MKTNNLLLFALLLLLSAIVAYLFLSDRSHEVKTFKTDIVNLDTAQVSSIVITNPAEALDLQLVKISNEWRVVNDSLNELAEVARVNDLLRMMMQIRAQGVVSKKSSSWGEYQVEEGQGTRVKVKEGDKTSLDLLVGKFVLKKPPPQTAPVSEAGRGGLQPQPVSFVRLVGEEVVYSVNGLLGMQLKRTPQDFIKQIIPEPVDSAEVVIPTK